LYAASTSDVDAGGSVLASLDRSRPIFAAIWRDAIDEVSDGTYTAPEV
jgi:hypothetical protein